MLHKAASARAQYGALRHFCILPARAIFYIANGIRKGFGH